MRLAREFDNNNIVMLDAERSIVRAPDRPHRGRQGRQYLKAGCHLFEIRPLSLRPQPLRYGLRSWWWCACSLLGCGVLETGGWWSDLWWWWWCVHSRGDTSSSADQEPMNTPLQNNHTSTSQLHLSLICLYHVQCSTKPVRARAFSAHVAWRGRRWPSRPPHVSHLPPQPEAPPSLYKRPRLRDTSRGAAMALPPPCRASMQLHTPSAAPVAVRMHAPSPLWRCVPAACRALDAASRLLPASPSSLSTWAWTRPSLCAHMRLGAHPHCTRPLAHPLVESGGIDYRGRRDAGAPPRLPRRP